MSETPQFIRDLQKKLDDAVQAEHGARLEIHQAQWNWEKAREAIKKFPGWKLTGERKVPVEGESFLRESLCGCFGEPLTCDNKGPWYAPRFILRKIEPPPETKPVRETILAEAKELAKKILSNPLVWGCRPETIQLANRVNDIPDQPEPRTVWACPGEVIERIENIKRWANTWDKPGISDKCEKLLGLCRSTREATVEEVGNAVILEDWLAVPKGSTGETVVLRMIERLKKRGIRLVKENSDG